MRVYSLQPKHAELPVRSEPTEASKEAVAKCGHVCRGAELTGNAGPLLAHSRAQRGAAHLHAPLEDGQRAARGEGPVGVLEAQHVAGIELLVDVGVRLELVALVAAALKQHAHARKLLILDLHSR